MKRVTWLNWLAVWRAWIVLLLLGLCAGFSWAQSSSAGKEFIFAFTQNYPGATPNLRLYVSSRTSATGQVTVQGQSFVQNFTVEPNAVTTITIPSSATASSSKTSNVVRVVASADVQLYAINQFKHTTDAFMALPVDALGSSYRLMSFGQNFSYPSEFSITAISDNTSITVTPSTVLQTGQSAGVPFTLQLNAGQTILYSGGVINPGSMSPFDVTGTLIESDAPVAVLSGARCANIPLSYIACDHIVEMLPPISTWGKTFLTVPLATRTRGDMFRVVAAEDGTQVKVNGLLVAILAKGAKYESVLTIRSKIETSKPVMVAQYSLSSTFDFVPSDPFMMLIPPTEQFLDSYVFSTPATGFDANFVNVVVPTAAIGGLTLDGSPVEPARFAQIADSNFSGAQIPIALGSHRMEHTDAVPFGIYVYGFAPYDSYGYPGGMSFKSINPLGDPYRPNASVLAAGEQVLIRATDSEDINANGVLDPAEDLNADGEIGRRTEDRNGSGRLDPGEDVNGNGILDRDTGIYRVLLSEASSNLRLNVPSFPRGVLSLEFAVERVDTSLPGQGTVIVEDGSGNRVEVPVGIGLKDVFRNVRLIETISARDIDIVTASFAVPPYAIRDVALGKEVEWRFDRFEVGQLASLRFDLRMKNPVPGERRVISQKLDLYYTDTGGNAVHQQLSNLSVDVLAFNYEVGPQTDKPGYGPGDRVVITGRIRNLTSVSSELAVRLSIRDANQSTVANLGVLPAAAVPAGSETGFEGLNYVLDGIYSGQYQVVAELLNSERQVVAMGSTPFAVSANATEFAASADIRADKGVYVAGSTVRLTSQASNLLVNAALDDVQVVTRVVSNAGVEQLLKTETLSQLLPKALREFRYALPLGQVVPGGYLASVTVLDRNGVVLASDQTSFSVQSVSDTGSGIKGTIGVNPIEQVVGEKVDLSFVVNNQGNAALVDLPLIIRVVKPATGELLAEFPRSTSLEIGGQYASAVTWNTQGGYGDSLVAVLVARTAAGDRVLAQSPFSLSKFKQTLDWAVNGEPRVLVLAACATEHPVFGTRPASGHQSRPVYHRACGNACVSCDPHPQPNCGLQRAEAIDDLLNGLGIAHRVTTDPQVFLSEMRTGAYNTYWVSGDVHPLDHYLLKELREVVRRGAGLMVDGAHSRRNSELDEMAGVAVRGQFSGEGLAAQTDGLVLAQAQLRINGYALRLDPINAEVRASAQESSSKNNPVIAEGDFGLGSTMFFGLDLVQSAVGDAGWSTLLGQAAARVKPSLDVNNLSPHGWLPGSIRLHNLGAETQAGLRISLPNGVALEVAKPAALPDVDNDPATEHWRFAMGAATTTVVDVALRAGAGTPGAPVLIQPGYWLDDQAFKPVGDPVTLAFEVNATPAAIATAQSLAASVVVSAPDRNHLRQAQLQLTQAANAVQARQWSLAILSLLLASETLDAIRSVDTKGLQLAIAQALAPIQWQWSNAQ